MGGHVSLRATRLASTHHAYCMQFSHVLCDGHELWHRSKRTPQVILIESRANHAKAIVRKLLRRGNNRVVKKLHLVDPDDACRDVNLPQKFGGIGNRNRLGIRPFMLDDLLGVVPIIHNRFE